MSTHTACSHQPDITITPLHTSLRPEAAVTASLNPPHHHHHRDYPLHLGVTEAGEGEDGRMKSAIGIGALLMDGLGDTIRVSLTEDPEYEINPCTRLANLGRTAADQVRGGMAGAAVSTWGAGRAGACLRL